MNLTADLHAKQRSVVDLRKRIHDAKDSIGRLKRRLALTEVRTNKCGKNVKTLEKKAVSHANRIENLARENEKYRSALLSKQQEVSWPAVLTLPRCSSIWASTPDSSLTTSPSNGT